MADVPHPHAADNERASYFLDQLFMIGVCGALAAVTLLLWQSGSLATLLDAKFALAVGAGGLCLLALVVLRAVAVWTAVDAPAEKAAAPEPAHGHGHEKCDHPHGEPHSHAHSHSHSHSHAHSHSHSHGHDHGGGAPWRYIVLLLPVVLYFLVLSNPGFNREPIDRPAEPLEYIINFVLIFRSILWEALPFIVLGAVIAGVLDEFLPQRYLTAVLPKNRVAAVALGGLLGLVFPMCECGIIPIMRRLLRKGLPLSCCVAYLLAGPIINVIVLLSTMAAFSVSNDYVGGKPTYQMDSLWMTLFRAGMGYVVAVVTGLVVDWQHKKHGDGLLMPLARPSATAADDEAEASGRPMWQRVSHASEKSLGDFVDITVFLILGALLSATVRMFLTTDDIASLGTAQPVIAISLMMGLAIVLCLCSEADAFVAASFSTLRPSAKLAFLVLGPMLDFKLYAMYTRIFRPRLIFTIYGAVLAQVFLYSVGTHYFWEANAKYLVNPKPPKGSTLSAEELKAYEERTLVVETAALLGLFPEGGPAQSSVGAALALIVTRDEKAPEISFLRLENATSNAQLRDYYDGKLVSMTGRWSGPEGGPYTLLRYKMNCCAADATPMRAVILVEDTKFNTTPFRNQWVRVTARVSFVEVQGNWIAKLTVAPMPNRPTEKLIERETMDANPYVN